MKRHREPRPKVPSAIPLDDGARAGTESWREVNGVPFCHWDRWLLRLALDEPEGLRSIARTFRSRATASRRIDTIAEAMLAQTEDLETRMAALGVAPAQVLDDVERASTWLRDKALRRIWQASTIYPTAAMLRTPRKVLEARALEGNWAAFPISPAPYLAKLRATFGEGSWYDYRATGLIVMSLDMAGEDLLCAATTDDERLAIRRAMLTAAIDAMARVDDSLDELGEHFRDHEAAYLALARQYFERPGIVRDLLEIVVWEDYGLFREVEPLLGSLPEAHADIVLRELASFIAELRNARLQHPLERSLGLRRAVLTTANGSDATRAVADDG